MRSGIVKVEYSVNAGPRTRIDYNRELEVRLEFSTPKTELTYVIVEFWIYDFAGNVGYQAFWYGLEGGQVVSVQPVYDGRVRVYMENPGYSVAEKNLVIPIVLYMEEYKWDAIPSDDYDITQLRDLNWIQMPDGLVVLINPKEYRCE